MSILEKIKQYSFPVPQTLYHATKLSNLDSVFKNGLQRKYCGNIHDKMDYRPPEKTIYLSKYYNSNNLNSNLFRNNEKIAVLHINAGFLNKNLVYPDDALMSAWANEQIWFNEHEIADDLNICLDDAKEIYNLFSEAKEDTLSNIMKPLWNWYLFHHGEISVSEDICPKWIFDWHIFNY